MNTHTEHQALALASDYAIDIHKKYTDDVQKLLHDKPLTQTLTDTEIATLCQDACHDMAQSLQDFQKNIRILRHCLMLRWIWQDALNLISVPQLTHELSVFADVCLLLAKDFAYQTLVKKYGEPIVHNKTKSKKQAPERQDLIIIAMGKMGAQELNLSSDIDLVFVYHQDAQQETTINTSQPADKKQKSIAIKRFMMLWGQQIIKLLDEKTHHGFVFRIDMRLRPWGDGSDLCINFNALRIYFTKHGREWERFAWLKARVVKQTDSTTDAFNLIDKDANKNPNKSPDKNRDKNLTQLNQLIQQFVFRYYVDYTAFAALREMKLMIMNQQRQRGDEDNVKLGAGGIRDIEFVVQAYQLIYGGRKTDLQIKHCLTALQVLAQQDIITEQISDDLQTAYLFLRRVEHALQAFADKQTQQLPKDKAQQHRLAQVLGFADWQAFLSVLNAHKNKVSQQFHELVADRETPNQDIDHDKALEIVASQLNTEEQNKLQQFLSSNAIRKLSAKAKERLEALWPELIKAIASIPHTPNTKINTNTSIAVERILQFLSAVIHRSIYLVLLKENPNGTAHLVRMMTASPWIANELTRYPVLLDEFLLNRNKALPTKVALVDKLRQQLLRVEPEDEEAQIASIRLFKKSEVLHVAATDILSNHPLMKISDGLTWIAEAVLDQALMLTFNNLTKIHGFPVLIHADKETVSRADHAHCGFGIIAYGKLGGIELSYGSDLDLVFLHRIDESADTDGKRPISGLKFISRLAKKLIAMLTAQTRDGRAYEIDMRLRPSGASGVMVSSLAAFENYQTNKAWLWEHQALVRARVICGDNLVAHTFNAIRKNILCQPRDMADTQKEVINMRQKMQNHLGSSKADREKGQFHIKHDAGGIVDIEFLAQYAVLMNGDAQPQVSQYTDNVRIFDLLAKTDFMTAEDADVLTQHYLKLRQATHIQALAEKNRVAQMADWAQVREDVMRLWQKYLGHA